MRVKLIGCKVMESELCYLMEKNHVRFDTEFIELDLHLYPDRLRDRLQSLLDAAHGYDRVLLAFGLCGGGTRELRNTDAVLTIPRYHDCVPMLIGGAGRYRELHSEETGTLYMSRGWLENRDGVVKQYDTWRDDYGEDSARMLRDAMYGVYKRLLLIKPQHLNCAAAREQAVRTADFLGLSYGEIDGRDDILEALVAGDWDDADRFINLAPHEVLTDHHFGL